MHALVHILSREKLSEAEIDNIMEPYYEENIFQYDPDLEEYVDPDVMPQFRWDYYRILDNYIGKTIGDCYVIIDPDNIVLTRKYWNGKTYIDQTDIFEKHIERNTARWKGCYIYELDIHW